MRAQEASDEVDEKEKRRREGREEGGCLIGYSKTISLFIWRSDLDYLKQSVTSVPVLKSWIQAPRHCLFGLCYQSILFASRGLEAPVGSCHRSGLNANDFLALPPNRSWINVVSVCNWPVSARLMLSSAIRLVRSPVAGLDILTNLQLVEMAVLIGGERKSA